MALAIIVSCALPVWGRFGWSRVRCYGRYGIPKFSNLEGCVFRAGEFNIVVAFGPDDRATRILYRKTKTWEDDKSIPLTEREVQVLLRKNSDDLEWKPNLRRLDDPGPSWFRTDGIFAMWNTNEQSLGIVDLDAEERTAIDEL